MYFCVLSIPNQIVCVKKICSVFQISKSIAWLTEAEFCAFSQNNVLKDDGTAGCLFLVDGFKFDSLQTGAGVVDSSIHHVVLRILHI